MIYLHLILINIVEMWTEFSNVFVLTLYLQDVFLSLDSAIKNIENGNWKMENS